MWRVMHWTGANRQLCQLSPWSGSCELSKDYARAWSTIRNPFPFKGQSNSSQPSLQGYLGTRSLSQGGWICTDEVQNGGRDNRGSQQGASDLESPRKQSRREKLTKVRRQAPMILEFLQKFQKNGKKWRVDLAKIPAHSGRATFLKELMKSGLTGEVSMAAAQLGLIRNPLDPRVWSYELRLSWSHMHPHILIGLDESVLQMAKIGVGTSGWPEGALRCESSDFIQLMICWFKKGVIIPSYEGIIMNRF